jgi:hypothetical protein
MSGVILLRLSGTSSRAKALAVIKALQEHHDQLHGAFTVISPGRVRIRRRLPPARVERPL